MDSKIFEILKKIGLTEGESKTYIALLSVGTSSVGAIIEKSGVSASKVYVILGRLIDKGLVSLISKSGVKIYSAATPERILDFLKEEEKRIDSYKEQISLVLPELKAMENSIQKKPEIEIMEGIKGFESVYKEALDSLKESDQYVALAGKKMTFHLGKYWAERSKEISSKGIPQFTTYENDAWFEDPKRISMRKDRVIYYPKVLPKKYEGFPEFECFGNIAILNDVDESGELFSLVIRNKHLVGSLRKLVLALRDIGEVPEGFETKELV